MRRTPGPARIVVLCLVAVLAVSCGDSGTSPEIPLVSGNRPGDVSEAPPSFPRLIPTRDRTFDGEVSDAIVGWNAELSLRGAPLMIAKVELLTDASHEPQGGRTLFASHRILRLDTRWVPGDARRNAGGDDLTYIIVKGRGATASGLTAMETEAAIDRALGTWSDLACSELQLVKREDTGNDPTIIDAILQMGEYGDPYLADIVNGGFMPAAFFDRLAPAGSRYILGATFTMIYVDSRRRPVDENKDGWYDTAVKEIYYNDAFPWALDDPEGRDVESVALHENGHALGLAHFGHLFQTDRNGKLHSSPRAVMNALYQGPFRDPAGTDRAAFCGTYATWPNR